MHITILFFIQSSRGLLHYREKTFIYNLLDMFSINFRYETEKNYLIVGWLFFSSDILSSLNNLCFIVSLV